MKVNPQIAKTFKLGRCGRKQAGTRQEQDAKEIKEYLDRFWSEGQNTPTRPPWPLK